MTDEDTAAYDRGVELGRKAATSPRFGCGEPVRPPLLDPTAAPTPEQVKEAAK